MLKVDPNEPIYPMAVIPKTDQDGVQKHTRTGVLEWTVMSAFMPENGVDFDTFKVTVASDLRPEITQMVTRFRDLRFGGWSSSNGGGVYYRAAGVSDSSSDEFDLDGEG